MYRLLISSIAQLFRPLDALILPLAGRRWLLGKLASKLGVP